MTTTRSLDVDLELLALPVPVVCLATIDGAPCDRAATWEVVVACGPGEHSGTGPLCGPCLDHLHDAMRGDPWVNVGPCPTHPGAAVRLVAEHPLGGAGW